MYTIPKNILFSSWSAIDLKLFKTGIKYCPSILQNTHDRDKIEMSSNKVAFR